VLDERGEMEAEQIVGEQAAQQLVTRLGKAEDLHRRPGNVPEVRQGEVRSASANVFRRKREVIVLEPDGGIRAAHLVEDSLREAAIHTSVALPVASAYAREVGAQVAERPEKLVGEAQVVAVDVVVGEPDAA